MFKASNCMPDVHIITYIQAKQFSDGGQGNNKPQVLQRYLDMAQNIRRKAADKSNDANKRAIKRHRSKLPHSVYAIGDRVLVKVNKKKWNRVKGKGVGTKQSTLATVVATNAAYNRYKVQMDNSVNPCWVSVSALTSLTREQERKRMKKSGM